jgi:hypothetical protein
MALLDGFCDSFRRGVVDQNVLHERQYDGKCARLPAESAQCWSAPGAAGRRKKARKMGRKSAIRCRFCAPFGAFQRLAQIVAALRGE